MAIPTWQRILDTELDAESPITQSLMERLYRNMFAVLGVDPASDTKPPFTLVPSVLHRNTNADVQSLFQCGSAYGLGVYTDDLPIHEVASGAIEYINPAGLGLDLVGGRHIVCRDDINGGTLYGQVLSVEVDYSAGAPANVVLAFQIYWSGPVAGFGCFVNGFTIVAVPITNAWINIGQIFGQGAFYAKAQNVGGQIYLRFQNFQVSTTPNDMMRISFVPRRFRFVQKG